MNCSAVWQVEAFELDPHPWASKFIIRDPSSCISHQFALQVTPAQVVRS